MRRSGGLWLVLAVLLVLIVAMLAALPEIIRRMAIARIAEATERPTHIADVDFNVFTGRVVVSSLTIESTSGPDPLLSVDRIAARTQWALAIRGQVYLTDLEIVRPQVRVRRLPSGVLEVPVGSRGSTVDGDHQAAAGGIPVTIERASVTDGSIRFADEAVKPRQTWTVEGLTAEAEQISTAHGGGPGRAQVAFRLMERPVSMRFDRLELAPADLSVSMRVQGFDLRLVLPYVPDSRYTLAGGKLTAELTLDYRAPERVRVDGLLTLDDVALERAGQHAPAVTAPSLQITLADIRRGAKGLTVDHLALEGAASVIDETVSPPLRLALHGRMRLGPFSWPPTEPLPISAALDLGSRQHISGDGTVSVNPLTVDMAARVDHVELRHVRGYLPLATDVQGRVSGVVKVGVRSADTLSVAAQGSLSVDDVQLGSRKQPLIAWGHAEAKGVDLRWPEHLSVEDLHIARPVIRLTRTADGEWPISRIMRQPASQRRLETNAEDELRLRFARVRVDNGRVLFTDESTDPNYAEEISKLFVRLDRVAKPGPPAHIKLQGVVKHGSALNIDGTLGLFGPSRYVQLQGELHDFAVPTTNPYVNQYLDWVARTGSLTTKVSYRIDGEHLNAVNQLVIDDLQVVRAGSDDEVERRIGMPLNLLVNLIKNARGEIRLTIPVSGRLDEPTFSLKDAIWSGVKNAVLNVLRAPFRLIGRLITGRDDTIAGLDIDPMRFEPGSVVPSAGMDEHVNRLTEFLREAPYAKVRFTPLLTARDITDLKAQEVAGRVQERQRALHLPSFADAARALFQEQWPDRAMPGTLTAVIAALVEAARPPAEETRRLSEARVQYVQQRLIQSEKIAADRLIVVDTPVVQPDLQPGGVALALEG